MRNTININIIKPSTVKVDGLISGILCVQGTNVYYHRKFKDSVKCAEFNIPDKGNYILTVYGELTKSEVLPLKKSDKASKIILPKPEKNLYQTLSGKYTTVKRVGYEGSPAMISTAKKLIIVNDAYFDLPLYAQKFIMFHELGHRYYSTEEFCDLYATKEMLNAGYNESSCVYSLTHVLTKTPLAVKRVQTILGNLNN